MRVIIAGSRYGRPEQEFFEAIAQSGFRIDELVHGGAQGVDLLADGYARYHEIPVTIFRAAWNTLGKAAGPMRNRQMAKYADALIALQGGNGTASMIREMRRERKPIYIHAPQEANHG